jgi:hypothetical protein
MPLRVFANIGFPVRPPSTDTVINGFKLNFSVITYMLNADVSLIAQVMETVSNEIYGTKREKSVIYYLSVPCTVFEHFVGEGKLTSLYLLQLLFHKIK